MRKLHFIYEMQIDYSVPVEKCNFTIKCIPRNTRRQHISNLCIKLYPATKYCQGIDGFGNVQIYGVNETSHSIFRFQLEGTAVTGLADYEEDVNEDIYMLFKHPHGLNQPGDGIKAFYEQCRPERDDNPYDTAKRMMHALYQKIVYEPGSTNVDTSAEEAFMQGKGVCQDYAHIFISLMHLAGIPARYITGLIVGEGASHAWVEILWNDKWYGLDPTNDTIVDKDHIKIGVGRDAKDCMINRGIMHGGGFHTQSVKVTVVEQ